MRQHIPTLTVTAIFAGALYMTLAHKGGEQLEQSVHIDCFDADQKPTGSADVPQGYFIQRSPIVTRITNPGWADYGHEDLMGTCVTQKAPPVQRLKVTYTHG